MLVDFLSIFFIIEYRHRQPALPGRQGLLIAYQNIHLLTLDNLLCLKTKKKTGSNHNDREEEKNQRKTNNTSYCESEKICSAC